MSKRMRIIIEINHDELGAKAPAGQSTTESEDRITLSRRLQ